MLFHVIWEFTDQSEDAEERSLSVFAQWTPPAGAEFQGFYAFADSSGGVAIIEVDSAATLARTTAPFVPWLTFTATPIIPIEEVARPSAPRPPRSATPSTDRSLRPRMTTYVALLRGINVSGRNKIAMAELRALVESLGNTGVQTYIQSGNVVLDSCRAQRREGRGRDHRRDRAGARPRRRRDRAHGGRDRRGAHREPAARARRRPGEIARDVPRRKPAASAVRALADVDRSPDEFAVVGREVFVHCPNGYGTTKLNNTFFEKRLGVAATTRNWRTVQTLAQHERKVRCRTCRSTRVEERTLSEPKWEQLSVDIEPFRVDVADDVIVDLAARLEATRWPQTIPGAGWDYGTDIEWLRDLCEYWRHEYSWARQQDMLNELPQVLVDCNGMQVHAIHATRRRPRPAPAGDHPRMAEHVLRDAQGDRPAERPRRARR